MNSGGGTSDTGGGIATSGIDYIVPTGVTVLPPGYNSPTSSTTSSSSAGASSRSAGTTKTKKPKTTKTPKTTSKVKIPNIHNSTDPEYQPF